MYHALIHRVIREMPVVVDPVYGRAHYTATLGAAAQVLRGGEDGGGSAPSAAAGATAAAFRAGGARGAAAGRGASGGARARDHLAAWSKDEAPESPAAFRGLGQSPLPDWCQATAVEATYAFLHTCPQVVRFLKKYRTVAAASASAGGSGQRGGPGGAKSPNATRPGPRARGGPGGSGRPRLVIVTNVGASNVKPTEESLECLASHLPAASRALALAFDAAGDAVGRGEGGHGGGQRGGPGRRRKGGGGGGSGRHRLVVLTQPLAHTRLEHRVPAPLVREVKRALEDLLLEINGDESDAKRLGRRRLRCALACKE